MTTANDVQINWAKLAHDLRGPLTPLQTAAWLLRNEPSASSHLELADILDRQTRRLARLIDELSDWGCICGKRDPLPVRPVEVSYLIDVAVANIPGCQVQPVFTEEAMRFSLEGDQHHLGKMLHSILDYAVHRDPARNPRVSVSVISGDLQIRVCDSGLALHDSAREALLSQSLDKSFDDGLGLRLLIARKIAEAHGGSLSVEPSAEGMCLLCVLPRRPS